MFRLRPSLLPVKSTFLLPGLPRILCLYNRPEYTSVGGGPVFFIWARDSLPVLGWLLISRGMITIGRDTEGRQREVQTTGAASRRPLPSSRPRDSFSPASPTPLLLKSLSSGSWRWPRRCLTRHHQGRKTARTAHARRMRRIAVALAALAQLLRGSAARRPLLILLLPSSATCESSELSYMLTMRVK